MKKILKYILPPSDPEILKNSKTNIIHLLVLIIKEHWLAILVILFMIFFLRGSIFHETVGSF